jgi:[citrate (pro-3S)-lyase] ligase
MDIELHSPLRGSKVNIWCDFLAKAGLAAEGDAQQTVLVWEDGQLIAAGSRTNNLLKYIAVDPAHQGEGLLAKVLTALRQEAFREGHSQLFLYTKPINEPLFADLMFYSVAQTGDVLLMEDRKDGIQRFIRQLPATEHSGKVGAAVMNCDPFTLGHQYLVETAAKACDWLYVFVLSEDKGYFSASDRLEMVRRGTKHLANVTVLPTGPYLISNATFPTYFLKNRDQADQIHCQLDVEVFARHFAPAFSITTRYVGTEPLSPLTEQYNEILKTQLPARGIQVEEIPRLAVESTPVSASAVRAALTAKDRQVVQSLVPHTTFAYLEDKQLI